MVTRKGPSAPALVAIALVGVAAAFQLIGLSTDGWINTTINTGLGVTTTTGYGLWMAGASAGWLHACRAFAIFGLVILVASFVVGLIICFRSNATYPLVASILAFIGGIFVLAEFAIYASKTVLGPHSDYGYSFAMTIIAWLLAMAAGIGFFLAKSKP